MEALSQKGLDIDMIFIEFFHLYEVFLTVIMDNLSTHRIKCYQ